MPATADQITRRHMITGAAAALTFGTVWNRAKDDWRNGAIIVNALTSLVVNIGTNYVQPLLPSPVPDDLWPEALEIKNKFGLSVPDSKNIASILGKDKSRKVTDGDLSLWFQRPRSKELINHLEILIRNPGSSKTYSEEVQFLLQDVKTGETQIIKTGSWFHVLPGGENKISLPVNEDISSVGRKRLKALDPRDIVIAESKEFEVIDYRF